MVHQSVAALKLFTPYRTSCGACNPAVMSGARKARLVANPLDSAISNPSELILRECHDLYIDDENGMNEYEKITHTYIYSHVGAWVYQREGAGNGPHASAIMSGRNLRRRFL